MSKENGGPIKLPTNYSGACEKEPLSNENILKITNRDFIGGSNEFVSGRDLFAIKYRVLPCTLNLRDSKEDDDNSQVPHGYSRLNSCSNLKKRGYYHATR